MRKMKPNLEDEPYRLNGGNAKLEAFLKSRIFSLLLSFLWTCFCVIHIRSIVGNVNVVNVLWVVYNIIVSCLLLIRQRPAVVSISTVHWVVAFFTSFSGFLFSQGDNSIGIAWLTAGNILIGVAILLGIISTSCLGRSYDIAPALREIKTKCVYRIVRHPIYLSSMLIKLGYVLLHASIYNTALFVVICVFYDRRARYEEAIMSKDDRYEAYVERVKYRFIWGVY
jgi:protein-S-isoprenylcysteine O-methyltransferase Ste14